MGEVIGKAGLRKCVRWRRGVDGLIMYFISSIAQCVRKSPVVGEKGCLFKKHEVWDV